MVPLAAPDTRLLRGDDGEPLLHRGQVFAQEVRKRVAAAPPWSRSMASMRSRQTSDDGLAQPASVRELRGGGLRVGGCLPRHGRMLGGELPHALEALIATGKPVALVALGNPYLLRNFPNVTAYLATFSTVPPSEIAAVQALWGEIDDSRPSAGDHPGTGAIRRRNPA